jgi:hypothetical protein
VVPEGANDDLLGEVVQVGGQQACSTVLQWHACMQVQAGSASGSACNCLHVGHQTE